MTTLNAEQRKRADLVGNPRFQRQFLEMYDFFVFGYYAAAIGKAFSPRKRVRPIDAGAS